MALVAIIEMLAGRSIGLSGLYIMIACYGALHIAASGTEEQKRRFLPDLAAGKLVFAYGLSEPDVGSDLRSVTTRAARRGDYEERKRALYGQSGSVRVCLGSSGCQ